MKSYHHALIIDDDPDLCLLLKAMLATRISNIQFAHSIENCRELLKTVRPDIVFMDNNLPDGKGVLFISEVKTTLPGVWVIIISAMGEYRKDAYANGAHVFIEKPLTESNLIKAFEALEEMN